MGVFASNVLTDKRADTVRGRTPSAPTSCGRISFFYEVLRILIILVPVGRVIKDINGDAFVIGLIPEDVFIALQKAQDT